MKSLQPPILQSHKIIYRQILVILNFLEDFSQNKEFENFPKMLLGVRLRSYGYPNLVICYLIYSLWPK